MSAVLELICPVQKYYLPAFTLLFPVIELLIRGLLGSPLLTHGLCRPCGAPSLENSHNNPY